MLVVDRASGVWEDRAFRDFPLYLRRGDCVVINDSRVFPSRLYGQREHGTGRVEVFLTKQLSSDGLTWAALVRPGKKMRTGERVVISDDLAVEILGRGEFGERTVKLEPRGDLFEVIERAGHGALALKLPSTRFRRSIGIWAGQPVDPQGNLISNDEYKSKLNSWIPTEQDRAFVKSLMKRVAEPGKIAGWVAPPERGINNLPVEYEYVRLH